MTIKRRNGELMEPPRSIVLPRKTPRPLNENIYTEEQLEWLRAVDGYKLRAGRVVLSARDILTLAISLGYRRIAQETPLPTRRKR